MFFYFFFTPPFSPTGGPLLFPPFPPQPMTFSPPMGVGGEGQPPPPPPPPRHTHVLSLSCSHMRTHTVVAHIYGFSVIMWGSTSCSHCSLVPSHTRHSLTTLPPPQASQHHSVTECSGKTCSLSRYIKQLYYTNLEKVLFFHCAHARVCVTIIS